MDFLILILFVNSLNLFHGYRIVGDAHAAGAEASAAAPKSVRYFV